MSTVQIEVVTISAINPHPGADRLEIAQVMGAECCVPVGKFKVGDLVLWFPPTLLIPNAVAQQLGVDTYLKHSTYPGETVQSKCRIGATRLRGVPSFGFIISTEEANKVGVEGGPLNLNADGTNDWRNTTFAAWRSLRDPRFSSVATGDNVDSFFGAVKYEPPASGTPGCPRPKGFNADAAPDNANFQKYTDIQHFYKYAPALPEGEPVRITEKVHGMNVRLGLVKVGDTDEFVFQAGSHKVNWKPEDSKGNIPIWWQLMTEDVVNLLTDLCNEKHNVIVFGELYGPGIQDMDYGASEELGFRIFDISKDGRYLNWGDVECACWLYGIKHVPLLYRGPFSKEVLLKHTYGPTTLSEAGNIKSKFKDREGCVVTPLIEQYSRYLGGRLVLKSVSADYLDRKGAQDN